MLRQTTQFDGRRLQRSPLVVGVEDRGATVLMDVEQGQYYSLDGAAPYVWEILAEPCSIQGIIDVLIDRYEAPEDVLTSDVTRLVQQLLEAGLVTPLYIPDETAES